MHNFYADLIEDSYNEFIEMDPEYTKTDFVLALFDIYLYEGGEDADFFAEKLLEVVRAISLGYTYEYHKENPHAYLSVLHFTGIANKVEWGVSIRGAHWIGTIVLNSTVLFDGKGNQILKMQFNCKRFKTFTLGLYEFYHQ